MRKCDAECDFGFGVDLLGILVGTCLDRCWTFYMWPASVTQLASCPFHYISRHVVMHTSPNSSNTSVPSVSYRVRSKKDVDLDVC